MDTREACVKRAASIFSEGFRVLYTYPLDEAARQATRPDGATFEENRARIAALRARAERAKAA